LGKIFDRLVFSEVGHLGDNLVQVGVVNYYADHCEELHLIVQEARLKTLTSLYKEHPNIKIIRCGTANLIEFTKQYAKETGISLIKNVDQPHMEFINGVWVPVDWPMHYYDFYGLLFSMRYTNFRVPTYVEGSEELYEKLSNREPYILTHRRFSEKFPKGYPINISEYRKAANLPDYRIIDVKPDITEDLMQYVTLIKNAKEIHCVDSSFYQLVDGMFDKTQAKLYFHCIRAFSALRVNSKWNNHRWKYIDYGVRL
jgi:hypothetical protein